MDIPEGVEIDVLDESMRAFESGNSERGEEMARAYRFLCACLYPQPARKPPRLPSKEVWEEYKRGK